MSLLFAVLFSSWITGAIEFLIMFLIADTMSFKILTSVEAIVFAIIWPISMVLIIDYARRRKNEKDS